MESVLEDSYTNLAYGIASYGGHSEQSSAIEDSFIEEDNAPPLNDAPRSLAWSERFENCFVMRGFARVLDEKVGLGLFVVFFVVSFDTHYTTL